MGKGEDADKSSEEEDIEAVGNRTSKRSTRKKPPSEMPDGSQWCR